MKRSVRVRSLVGVVVVAFLAVACGGGDDDESAGGNDVSATSTSVLEGPNPFASPTEFCTKHDPPPGTRRASSPGVTADEIVIVEGSADVSNIARQGITPPPNEASYRALFDEINDCGGINGRKIVLRRVAYNSSATDVVEHATSNCVKATEEYKAFIILNSTTSSVFPRCATVQHRSILMTGNSGLFNTADQKDSEGRLMSRSAASDQVSAAFVDYAIANEMFEGKKVMVLGVQRTPSAPAELQAQYVAPLEDAGIDAYLEMLPCVSGNNCRSQIGPAVSRAKARGVEMILTSQQFVPGVLGVLFKNMYEQDLRAPIVGPVSLSIHADAIMPAQLSDAGAEAAKFIADVGVTAYTFHDNAVVGAWRTGVKPTAFGQMCLDTLNRRLNNDPPWSYAAEFQKNGFWSVPTQACKEVRSIAQALWQLGNDLTTERAVEALAEAKPERVEDLPPFDEYTFYTATHPRPTHLAPLRYHYPCSDAEPTVSCMLPDDPIEVDDV
jgi:ABC-type branched-subunit amino acid transport system substrate-binding protein